tara:strand:- start:1395 stop:2555 length:1161 start_codon:yes stop_codon:yes gene_type:complete
MKKITLVDDTISKEDIERLVAWLSTDVPPRLTKGPVTIQLENKWSNWLGVNNTVFCNSGSSANLLMLWALYEAGRIPRNAKIIVPAISWATDLSPVIQLGFEPIICDCNMKDLSVDIDHLKQIIREDQPHVLLLVSVLGLVPDMQSLKDICDENNVILLEDTCESMGSKFRDKKLGTFGLMSSFSTYFGHHISTIEGGFVSTDDEELYEVLKAIRSHGWTRDSSKSFRERHLTEWNTSEFDSLYTFYYSGFNLRSTDLQAYIGLGQIDKLDQISKIRNRNFKIYNEKFSDISPIISEDTNYISNFAYPIIHENRTQIVENLIKNNVEVRPLICGSMGNQPFYVKNYGKNNLKNSSVVDKNGLYIPNHDKLSEEEVNLVVDIVRESV